MFPRHFRAFTLIELMVSMSLLAVLVIILMDVLGHTLTTWRYSTGKAEEFRIARAAFESMTRRLGQATLNTYWGYFDSTNTALSSFTTGAVPVRYGRLSDLRFANGDAQTLTGAATPPRPTHAVFFQAPLGTVDRADFSGLGNLLNSCGYFVEYDADTRTRPAFLNSVQPPIPVRSRFRLMEMIQPSNRLTVYASNPGAGFPWISDLFKAAPAPLHPLAENVIALVLLPKLPAEEDVTGVRLCPSYTYDSTVAKPSITDAAINPFNQLPPLVQVTLVAIDEVSAARLSRGSGTPDLGLGSLFSTTDPKGASNYASDLRTLEKTLTDRNLGYRLFSTNVALRAAKWSRN